MFLEILQTLIKVLIVFFILIVAFGLAFYILLMRVRMRPITRIMRLQICYLTYFEHFLGKSFSLQYSAYVCDAYIRHDVG